MLHWGDRAAVSTMLNTCAEISAMTFFHRNQTLEVIIVERIHMAARLVRVRRDCRNM